MSQTVTVNHAIEKGKRMISYPIWFMMLAFISFGMTWVFTDANRWEFILTGFLGAFTLPWFYWSLVVTKWRVWAFENVRNVHELKKRAINEKLIWPTGSIFEKTEIRTATQRERLEALTIKFTQPDIFTDDPTVPAETIIRYSKVNSIGLLPLGAVFIAIGIYLLIQHEYKVACCGLLASVYILYMGVKQTRNRKIQLIISNKGIKSVDTPLRIWQRISGEKIAEGHLVYHFINGSDSIQISELDISKPKLENLLYVYRGRADAGINSLTDAFGASFKDKLHID